MTIKVTYILRISGRHVSHESWNKIVADMECGFSSKREYWLPDVCHRVIIEGKDFDDCDEQMRAFTKAFRDKETFMEREEKNFTDKYTFDYSYEVLPEGGCENEG